MTFLFVLAALVVVVGGAAAVALAVVGARKAKASFARDNELIPGVPTSAPGAWAGSHDPEARLHRRLRDALAALRANQAFDQNGALLDLRVDLEQQSLALDEQLVATAALPVHLRVEPLERITAAVASIEQAVAELAGSSAAEAGARLARVLDDVRSRTGAVAQARAALDELDRTTPGTAAPGAFPATTAGEAPPPVAPPAPPAEAAGTTWPPSPPADGPVPPAGS